MDKIKNWRNIAFGLLALLAMACTDETGQGGSALGQGEVALQWLGPNMGIQRVSTRGSDPKTAEEQAIHNVHVFIFKADGSYLAATDNDAFQGYQFVSDGQNLVLQSSMFEGGADDATVVAVANVPSGTFGELNSEGHPDVIDNKAELAEFIFNLPTFTATMPETGLPMIGVADVDLSSTATGKVYTVQMKSLMARIDLDFTMDPYQSSDDGQNPALRIDNVYVGNFPTGCTIDPQLDPTINTGNTAAEVTTGISLLSQETEVTATDFTGHVLREGSPQSLTLYMFEHARAAKALEEVFKEYEVGDDGYPENIADDEKQRYKNSLAHKEAAYISLEGVYTNHNGYKYAVTYTLYPGADATDDFTIKHNRQYIHNITVTGITVNNMGKEALLDTRVDIDSKDNPYFIEMLREREHDAHFCVTPMDVFIYKGGSVKIEIKEVDSEKVPSWIRMEPMRYAPKECNLEGKWAADKAGEGKRKYFLTNLVQADDNGNAVLQGQDYYTSYTVEYGNPENTNYTPGTYEERIYFYIDENVPTREQSEKGENVPAREARLHITYTNTTGNYTHERDIIIRQAGMLAVNFPAQKIINANDGNRWGYVGYTFYIETYEEYLEHYDGKDQYDHSYPGLEWGFMNIKTSLGNTNGNYYMPYGWRNTMTIMDKFREEVGKGTYEGSYDITLNDKPRGASEYCYNKNKRNEQGKVEVCHWFHPTIRELENAIDTYYGQFIEFQDNWYWSSNPGPWGKNGGMEGANVTWTGEHAEYARATKANYNSVTGKFDHATSEANKPYAKLDGEWDTPYTGEMGVSAEGEGGYARRNKVFRIRAAYIVEAPEGQRGYDSNPPSIDNRSNVNDYNNN